jgi:serine/threonine protein kinase
VAERFGAYTIHEELGAGGMASVHLADWRGPKDVRRRVALKRLYPQIAEIPELLAMFIDEARLARYLRHPNIAEVYEYGRISGTYFIAFEFVAGPTIQQLARQCNASVGDVPIPIVLEIARQICDALDHAHNLRGDENEPLGIVHRDVSPQNLIISNVGFVKLIDFGLAKAKYSSVQSQAGVIKGKLHYIAPEYLAGSLDARCDVWAVGVVMHELLTGKRLFEAREDFEVLERVRSMPIPPPSRLNPQVSRVLDDIVLTALERDPRKRWHTAAELRTALEGHAAEHKPVTKTQLVAWVEWAFSQKQKQRQDSGISALDEIIQSGELQEVDELEDAQTAFIRLPASSAAMLQRRRESAALQKVHRESLMAPIGAAMLDRHKPDRTWLWILVIVAVIAGVLAALAHFGVIVAPHL